MSIKIYDGLRAVGTPDVFNLARKIRDTLEPAFFTELDRVLKDLGLDAPAGPHAVASMVTELHASRERTLDPLDLGYDIFLLPGLDWPLVQVFGERGDLWTGALIDANIVENYGYWDNVDPEEGINDAQWEHRRRDWGQAMRRSPGDELFSAAPVEAGLSLASPGRYQIYRHLCGL